MFLKKLFFLQGQGHLFFRKNEQGLVSLICIFTPDYKDKKNETEKAKTYNTPFLSLKRPDFKYVIFKIVEVAPRNPPAKQHSRFGPIPPNVGQIGCAT